MLCVGDPKLLNGSVYLPGLYQSGIVLNYFLDALVGNFSTKLIRGGFLPLGIMCHIQVMDSFGISLRLHSRINMQTCVITGFGLAIDKPVIVLAIRALVNLILKESYILNVMQVKV